MRHFILCFLLIFLLMSPAFSQSAALASPPAWASIGPYDIQWTLIAPSNPQILFSLSKSPYLSQALTQLCSLLRSSDAGLHWVSVADGLACGILLVIDPSDPNVLYNYTPDQIQGVLRSPDGGQSWLPFATPPDLRVGMLQINPGNSLYMYIGSYSSGNYISTDGGQIWTKTDCIDYGCEYLVFSPENPQIVYGMGWNSDVYKSSNGGLNWVNKNTLPLTGAAHCRGPLINPLNPSQLFINCEYAKSYLSNTAGDTWEATTLYDLYAFDPFNEQIFYKVVNNNVYRTDNSGGSWTLITGKFPGADYMRFYSPNIPVKMIRDPLVPGHLYCVTGLGLYQSGDWGDHWQVIPAGYGRGAVVSLALAKGHNTPFYAALTSVSSFSPPISMIGNRSGNWSGLPQGTGTFAVDRHDPTSAYLAVYNTGVYKTTNSGVDWTLKITGMSNTYIQTLAVSNFSSSTIYAGAWYNGSISAPGGFYKSINGGDTWQIFRAGIDNPNIYTIAQHPSDPNILYVGVKAAAYRVYKSLDGGQTWNPAAGGLPNSDIRALQVDPFHPETVYAATYGSGVYKTSNGGDSWIAANAGLTDSPNYTYALALDPTTPDTLYVGTSSSVFYSLNGGASWARLGASLPSGVLSLVLDPDDPHILYAGSGLFGVYMIHIPYTLYLPQLSH